MCHRDTNTGSTNANLQLHDRRISSVMKDIENDPITNKVPVEITTHIFQSYVKLHRKEGNLANEPTFGFDEIPVGVPLRLGAVCRMWRGIAWDTPALWTNLVVDLLSKGHGHGPELVKEWLARTAGLSVNLALRLHVDTRLRHQTNPLVLKGQQKRDAEAIVRVLIDYWPKLKSIDLRDVPWHLAIKLNSGAPSALENLCVGGFGNHCLKQSDPKLFRQTPHKHSPNMLSILSTISPTLLNIDWSKMTTLDIDSVARETVFEIITLCAATLTNITLKAIGDDEEDIDVDEDWLPTRVVNLPALIGISFTEMDTYPGFTETLFDHITAPALRALWYYGLEEDNVMPVDSITSFIQRSSCKIVHFLLQEPSFFFLDSEIDGDTYMPLLRAMPCLRVLDVSLGANFNVEPLFLALSERDPRTDRPTFLPHLKEFDCAVFPTFEWALFPEIWMATHPSGQRIGDMDFRFSEVCLARARAKLAGNLTLRGPLDKENLMDGEALMALMAIKAQSYAEISVTTDPRGKTTLEGRKFLEESFIQHFPKELRSMYSEVFQAFQTEDLF